MTDATSKGAKLLIGGSRPKMAGELAEGYFFEPTVLGEATVDMKIFKEETFGPAIPCFRFKEDSEAIKLANDTEYGLAAYFYTKVQPGIAQASGSGLSPTSMGRFIQQIAIHCWRMWLACMIIACPSPESCCRSG